MRVFRLIVAGALGWWWLARWPTIVRGRSPSATYFQQAAMLLSLVLIAFLASCHAMTVTYRMQPNERACFYALTRKADEKLAFYYAVSHYFHCCNAGDPRCQERVNPKQR